MKRITFLLACLLSAGAAVASVQGVSNTTGESHWVGTWGTAPQLVEQHNNPPSPGLGNNSLRQIVQVSIGGERVRLKLTNEFSTGATEIKAVELAYAQSAGSSSDIVESSTVSVTFDGSASVTMAAGGKAVSDPVDFHLDDRQNVAITIHYGSASSTSVSGHPGSRTTSYLKQGNTTNFSGATKTDHWYTILALEVEAPETTGTVAILGNSITDGRGSTTNQQNRWPDVLSRRLNTERQTTAMAPVGVLNMGIGGNCVLAGGLGPTGQSRYGRDLLGQEGVKWIILFEAVNDLGSAQNGVQTAKRIIDVYRQIIREAHQRGIYVFGATITPFKGNNYYSVDHEKGRSHLNNWIRTTKMLDGVIDFDRAVRNPQDTLAMQSQFLFENDWLHLNALGYETMGGAIDLSLFTKTDPLAADDEEDDYGEATWIEAESLRTGSVGTAFQVVSDDQASDGKYLKTVTQTATAAPTDSAYMLTTTFTTPTAATYYVYGRVLCPTWDDDSYWVGVDGPMNNYANGLQTMSWDWKELFRGTLQAGEHRLTLAGREDGACLDKLCITANAEPPSGMGGKPRTQGIAGHMAAADAAIGSYSLGGTRLAPHHQGLRIDVQRTADGHVTARKVVN